MGIVERNSTEVRPQIARRELGSLDDQLRACRRPTSRWRVDAGAPDHAQTTFTLQGCLPPLLLPFFPDLAAGSHRRLPRDYANPKLGSNDEPHGNATVHIGCRELRKLCAEAGAAAKNVLAGP